jgi:hypothetical protein
MADVKVRVVSEADNKGIDSSKAAFNEFKKAGGALSQELFGVNLATIGVGTAVTAAGKFIIDATKQTMEYADAVRGLSRNLGISAEEASKLIQVGDDFNITQDQMTTALQLAVKNAFVPSIENLSKLSDEYNRHTDPVERAAEMTKIFGRNWTMLTPILEAGRDAIKASADAAQDLGLVMSKEDVASARQLEIGMDNLNDQWKAMQLEVGKEVIPILSKAATAFNVLVTWNDRLTNALDDHQKVLAKNNLSYADYVEEQTRAIHAAGKFTEAELASAPPTMRSADAVHILSEWEWRLAQYTAQATDITVSESAAMQALADASDSAARAILNHGDGMDYSRQKAEAADKAIVDYARDLADAQETVRQNTEYTKNLAAAEKQLADDLAAGYGSASPKITADKQAIEDLKKAHHIAMLQMQADLLQYGLTLDGTFDAKDQQRVYDYELAIGLLTQADYDELTALLARKAALDSLPTSWSAEYKTYWMTYYLTYGEAPPSGTPTNPNPAGGGNPNTAGKRRRSDFPTGPQGDAEWWNFLAGGGQSYQHGTQGWETVPPGFDNDTYPVRMSSGEKFAVIPAGGGAPEGGAVVINNYGSITFPENQKETLAETLRKMR